MGANAPVPPTDLDTPARPRAENPPAPPLEWSEYERFVAVIFGMVAGVLVVIGFVIGFSCGSLIPTTSTPPSPVYACTYPFVQLGTIVIYVGFLFVCLAFVRPTQPVDSNAPNVRSDRYGALALFLVVTLIFVVVLVAGW